MKMLLLISLLSTLTLQAAEPSFEIYSYTGKDLFPSAIISTATVDWSEFGRDEEEEAEATPPTLGDTNGWLGVTLSDVPAGASIKVEMSGDGWLKPSRFVGKAEVDGEELEGEISVMPKEAWDYEALGRTQQQKPITLTVKVTINGKELPEQTETLVMRSVNDCPFYVLHGDDEKDLEDISWCFAAYVNENHPLIDGILKEALETARDVDGKPLLEGFTGYQSEDSQEVLKQVFAIWQVLQRRGIKYSDISTTVPSKTVESQTVRFVDESVEAKQANCVDGSVLMASILTKIGLNTYLVMVPGHCYLAFDEDEEGESMIGLETTMLGEDNLKSIDDLKNLQRKADGKKVDMKNFNKLVAKEAAASMKTFLNAIETGNDDLEKHAKAFEKGTDPRTQLISIAEWRELGIRPLASGKDRR